MRNTGLDRTIPLIFNICCFHISVDYWKRLVSVLRNVHSRTFLIMALSIEFRFDRWTIDRKKKQKF